MLVPLICILLRPCSGWQVESLARCFSALFYFTGDHFIPSLCHPPPNQQLRQMHSAGKADLCHPPTKYIQSSFVTVNSFTCKHPSNNQFPAKRKMESTNPPHCSLCNALCKHFWSKMRGLPRSSTCYPVICRQFLSSCLSQLSNWKAPSPYVPSSLMQCDAATIETFQVCKVFRQMES